MRKLLLAGVAISGAAAYLPTVAQAQSPVFPMTSRAGKLDGAAPGSVQVSIGVTMFSGIEFMRGTGDHDADRRSDPNLLNYVRLYPNFDYVNPSGIHFGMSAEVRSNAAAEGKNRNTNTLYWHTATGYVSSPKFGKFEFGSPSDAMDQLGVGTGDDFGTGGFYGEYGWPNAAIWLAADAYDGDSPKQKLAYITPSFAGLTGMISYQPTSVGLNNSSSLLDVNSTTTAAQSKDRISVAVQFSHAFGPASLKADVAYTHADVAPYETEAGGKSSAGFKDVSFVNVGAVGTMAGFEVEGWVNTGKFAANFNDSGAPFGPLIDGQRNTTAWLIGVGYTFGPFSIGAQYYNAKFDGADAGSAGLPSGPIGSTTRMDGESISGGYQVGPGVGVYVDAMTNQAKNNGVKNHGSAIGLGTYFSW